MDIVYCIDTTMATSTTTTTPTTTRRSFRQGGAVESWGLVVVDQRAIPYFSFEYPDCSSEVCHVKCVIGV